jgi:hypothetical protein
MGSGEDGALGRAAPMTRISAIPAVLTALLFLVVPLSPLQAQAIHPNADNVFGTTVYSTERRDVDLEGGSPDASRSVNFQFVAGKPVPNPYFPYVLAVHTQTPDWIFIQRGPSLLLKLDGTEMMQLAGDGSENAREVGVNGHVTEGAYYALTPEKLKRIAAAKSVTFRIVGDRQTISGAWRADLLGDAAAFAAQGPQLLEMTISPPVNNPPAPAAPVTSQARPILGVGFTDVPAQLAATIKLDPPQGALVLEVAPGSIASKAGIAAGDVILEFGSTPIVKAAALPAAVAKMQPGQHVAVKIWHAATSTRDIQF